MKESITGFVFMIAFMICGCGIDSAFESKESFTVWAISLIVLIAAAKVLGGGRND